MQKTPDDTENLDEPQKPRWIYFFIAWFLVVAVVAPTIKALLNWSHVLEPIFELTNSVRDANLRSLGFNIVEMQSFGLILGFCQWLVLGWYLKNAYRWLVGTMVAYALVAVMYTLTDFLIRPGNIRPIWVFMSVQSVITGAIIGACQALALRIWIRETVGWVALVMIARLLDVIPAIALGFDYPPVIFSIITAGALALLLKKNWPDIYAREYTSGIYV